MSPDASGRNRMPPDATERERKFPRIASKKPVPVEVVFDVVDGGGVGLDVDGVERARLRPRMQSRMLERRVAAARSHLKRKTDVEDDH